MNIGGLITKYIPADIKTEEKVLQNGTRIININLPKRNETNKKITTITKNITFKTEDGKVTIV
jgi:hypothetical protein